MAPITTANASRRRYSPRGLSSRPNVVGLLAVLVLAPLIGLISSSAEYRISGIVAAGIALLLIVLWSAEATFYVLIFSMLLSPEFIIGDLSSASGATASRGFTLRGDDFVILMIALAWLVRLAVYKEASVLRRSALNAPIGTYIGFSAFSTLFAAMLGRVRLLTGFFFVLKYFEYTVIYFLVINYIRDRAQVRRLLYAAMVTAVIISIIAITQIPSGERLTAPFEGEEGEPNTLGGYLVLALAIGLAALSDARDGRQWLTWGPAVAIMSLPLAFTYSRTSWLAFGAMMLALAMLSRRKVVFFALVAVFLVILIVASPESLVERASYTLSSQRGSISFLGFTIEPSAGARIQAWALAGQALATYPIMGAGVTGYGLIDAQYPRTIAETGLIGLAIFLWLLWRLASVGFELRRIARTQFDTVLANGFLAGLFGLIVHGIGANTFIIVRIMEPFWLIAGLVVASTRIIEEEEAAEEIAS